MLPVAILAGGLATRLRPLTETVRNRWSVGGKPFIEHQLNDLARQGVKLSFVLDFWKHDRSFVGSGSNLEWRSAILVKQINYLVLEVLCCRLFLSLKKIFLYCMEIRGLISIIKQLKKYFQRVNQV